MILLRILIRDQILKLFNWSTIEDSRQIAENIRTHKILTNKKPYDRYLSFTNNTSEVQVKYKYINTKLRSEKSYNNIPLNIRNKSIKNFKISYKIHRIGLRFKPKVIKNKLNSTYTLVWPGS